MTTWKFYEILEVDKNATDEQIKKAYRKLSLKWHPDKNRGKEKLAEKKFKEITEANSVLLDKEKKEYYDRYGDDSWEYEYREYIRKQKEKKFCSQCQEEIRGEEFVNRVEGKFFCSKDHADEFLEEWLIIINGTCRVCGGKHNENQGIPPKCEKTLPFISELKGLRYWHLFSKKEKDYFLERIREVSDFYNGGDREIDFYGKLEKRFREAEKLSNEKKEKIDQERNEYIQKIKDLDGWDLLDKSVQDWIIDAMGRCVETKDFQDGLQYTKGEINKIRGDDDRDIKVGIQEAIQEVKIELSREPKVAEEELESNWQDYLWDSSSLIQLDGRKKQVIDNIKTIREQKKRGDLGQFRKEAILQIRKGLSEDPPIKTEELSIPDWEERINGASEVGKINLIRSLILAEISEKRNKDFEKDSLGELLQQAREPQNWNNPQSLVSILKEIKGLRNSDSYQEKKLEIRLVEERLQMLDSGQYEETSRELLDQLVELNELNDGNMDQETKRMIDDAKSNPTIENQEKAEELICQNGSNNKLDELCQNIETKIKKGNLTEEKREDLINKIQRFITKNNYQRKAYNYRKQQVDGLLEQLTNWKEQDNNEQSLLPEWFWPVAIASCLGMVVISIALWMKGRNKERS